jgi:energy-converting hydrogenase B subunit K
MKEEIEINFSCINCDSCRQICPEGSVLYNNTGYAIETWSCINCELCIQVCPVDAIKPINS